MSRILVINDRGALTGIESLLSIENLDVLIAGSIADAIRTLDEELFDIVILDLIMPRSDEPSLLAAISRIAPRAAVVAVTGTAPGCHDGPPVDIASTVARLARRRLPESRGEPIRVEPSWSQRDGGDARPGGKPRFEN